MTVSIAGKGTGKHSWKVPNHCVHVIQWFYNMKVQWTTIGIDGELIDGLSPVYDFLADHVLCHRDQKTFEAPPKPFVSGTEADQFSASRFGQNQIHHPLAVRFENLNQSARMKQMGVGAEKVPDSPPSKIAKTVTVTQFKTKTSVLKLQSSKSRSSPMVVGDESHNVVNNITVTKSVTNDGAKQIDFKNKMALSVADVSDSKSRTVTHQEFGT